MDLDSKPIEAEATIKEDRRFTAWIVTKE